MTIGSVGTNQTGTLWALPGWSASLSPGDVASIGRAIAPDKSFHTILSGYGAGATGVLATGDSHTNTTIDNLVVVAGGAPLSQIRVGDLVCGDVITPGSVVSLKPSATSITLSKATLATNAGNKIAFVRPVSTSLELGSGILRLPGGRGEIKLLPGDIVAIDGTGWPIVISAAAISYGGTSWSYTP